MTLWRIALGSVLMGLAVIAGCSDDEDPAAPTTTEESSTTTTSSTTTVPERPASTTTTALDPATVEGQVEAAYLRSWDVYAEAVYNLELDEAALAEVYAEPLLSVRRDEIADRIEEGRAALVRVEHNYVIEMTGPDTAAIIDTFVNHQVLIDPVTKQIVEPDPNETVMDVFTARRDSGGWRLFDHQRVRQ